MGRESKTLCEKEKLFCALFAEYGNPREAAARAGYAVFPYRAGLRLLKDKRIVKEIERRRKERCRLSAVDGLRRLAFGGICDSVRLVFGEQPAPEELEKLDLFNVSEIKRPKDGCLEIKFFDRIKALERLAELDSLSDGNHSAASFYQALEQSASKLDEG